ncbi:MAG: DUF1127 domain-containing protein [Pannonibacter sp.]
MYALALAPLISRLSGFVANGWRAFRNRRQIAELTTWTDEQLRDIGLTRGDVRAAMGTPLFADPSSVLVDGRSSKDFAKAYGKPEPRGELGGAMIIDLGAISATRTAPSAPVRLAV